MLTGEDAILRAMRKRSRKKRSSVKQSKTHEKNPAAVALGRLGGLKGGPALNRSLTAEERSSSARRASVARWKKTKKRKGAKKKP